MGEVKIIERPYNNSESNFCLFLNLKITGSIQKVSIA